MTLRHLKMFVTVCETGSVTRASEILYIAQPTVSHAISELEKYYNVRLFDRINQRLILTDTGRELLVTAKEVLAGFESFERLASFGGQSPRVRIGASLTLGQTLMPPYLVALAKAHPEIEAQFVIKTSASIQSEIENGNLDFAIIEGEISSPYLKAELFKRDRIVAVANTEYEIPNTLDATELAHYPLLLRDHGSASRAFLEKLFTSNGLHIRPRIESVNDQALIAAVYASLGVAFLPESFVLGHIARGKFKEIVIQGIDSERNNYLITTSTRRI